MTPRADSPAPVTGSNEPRIRRFIVAVAVTGAVASVAALGLAGPAVALSVVVGGAVATANLWALARIVTALLPTDEGTARAQSRAGWALVGVLKTLALLTLLWLLMRHGLVSALPLFVGLGALPIGIAIGSLVRDTGAPHDRP
jgi:hypothetical protein